MNANQYAAPHSERVQALVIEDIGVVLSADMPDIATRRRVFATHKELEPYWLPLCTVVKTGFEIEAGWTLANDPSPSVGRSR